MKIIKDKKINSYVMIAVLFLSFGYAQWQSTRGVLAYLSYSNPSLKQSAWMFNDVVAILMGGVVPLLVYELITSFVSRFVGVRVGGMSDGEDCAANMKYALRFFYIGANIVIGSVKFAYYASPMVSVFGNVLIDFIVTTAFFVGFLAYSMRNFVDNTRWGVMLLSAGGTYIVIEAVITVVNLISGVIMG